MTEITKTIVDQIGHKAFYMMGAKNIVTHDANNSVLFNIRGSRHYNKIQVKLNGLDLYDVTFYKLGGAKTAFKIKKELTINNLYFDQLHSFIEKNTELYLSL